MTSLEIIKDELAKMPESPATKALSVAVSALNYYMLKSNYSFVDEGRNYSVDYKCYELDENTYADLELGTKANETLSTIANILSGGEDGK